MEEDAIANSGKWPREWLIKNKCDTDRIGTISYASTLAEFISNFYTDFMGYQPMALDSTIYLTPRLAEELRYISAILPYKQAKFQYELLFNADESDYTIIISRILGDEPFKIKIQLPGLDPVHFYFNKQNTSHSFRFNLDFRRSIKILPQLDWHLAHPETEE